MTDCRAIEPLIERLSDGEASSEEKLAAESHLATCRDCRLHLDFLVSTRELAWRPLPEPPESYWEHLPRRVLARIEERPARGWLSSFLFAPSTVRWGALGATLVVVAAVALNVVRPTSRPAPMQSVAPAAAPPEPAVQAEATPAAPPPMARDEASAPAELNRKPRLQEERAEAAESEPVLSEEKAREVVPAAKPAPARAMSATRARTKAENCDELRELVASSEESHLADAMHALALCSLNRYDRTPTEELRLQALEHAESFLTLEREGPRADEIRERKRLLEK